MITRPGVVVADPAIEANRAQVSSEGSLLVDVGPDVKELLGEIRNLLFEILARIDG